MFLNRLEMGINLGCLFQQHPATVLSKKVEHVQLRSFSDARKTGAKKLFSDATAFPLTSLITESLSHLPTHTYARNEKLSDFFGREILKNCTKKCNALYFPIENYHFKTAHLMMTSVTQPPLKNCDGGHFCSPPKECCKQGCCYLLAPSVSYRPPTLPASSMLNPLFLGHWYFWAAVTATVAGILCACSLWRRHSQSGLCCRNSGRDDRASEPDSNGSCYAPPHYSRCNSFHQAPPPYSEVASKPNLYPLVISYNGYHGDSGQKVRGSSTGYLMVQYFRNYIVRPVGTLSATSTMDSLGSSFICNAANEANTIIPPPYSCTGSLEEVNSDNQMHRTESSFPRSISSVTCNDYQCPHHTPSLRSQNSIPNTPIPHIPSNTSLSNNNINNRHSVISNTSTNQEVSITNNPCYVQNLTIFSNLPNSSDMAIPQSTPSRRIRESIQGFSQNNCDETPLIACPNKGRCEALPKELSADSESQEDHNFSDLLNLSVCIPSSITQLPLAIVTSGSHPQDSHQYSVVNSITSSDISSLANLGTPDSPPRATSPTAEIRELLDKIQQLPQARSPAPIPNAASESQNESRAKRYFGRNKAKTLYMPLNEGPSNVMFNNKTGGFFTKPTRGWLSRSAPNTPCGNFVPTFPAQKKSNNNKASKSKICDGSPLLDENEESDEERVVNKCL